MITQLQWKNGVLQYRAIDIGGFDEDGVPHLAHDRDPYIDWTDVPTVEQPADAKADQVEPTLATPNIEHLESAMRILKNVGYYGSADVIKQTIDWIADFRKRSKP